MILAPFPQTVQGQGHPLSHHVIQHLVGATKSLQAIGIFCIALLFNLTTGGGQCIGIMIPVQMTPNSLAGVGVLVTCKLQIWIFT